MLSDRVAFHPAEGEQSHAARHIRNNRLRALAGQVLMPASVILICAGMLFLGAAPLPYGYYMLLRIVACGVFAYAAFVAHERESSVLPWVYGLLAITFNPVVKVHFPKEIWAVIDVASGIFLLVTSSSLKSRPATSS